MQVLILILLVSVVGYRLWLSIKSNDLADPVDSGSGEFIGDQQIQADHGEITTSTAGTLAVLADGIGREKRGALSSRLAVEAVTSLFQEYQVLPNPVYFFKRSFHYANTQILKALDDRAGGASVASVLIYQDTLYYALAGNIKIALFRNRELIPLSEGHTIGKLAENAYKQGRLTRQEALAAIKEERLYNYVGQDGFRDLELFDVPVKLKKDDLVVLMTKGIYEALPWNRIESILSAGDVSARHQAARIIQEFTEETEVERDNGSIIVLGIKK